MRLLVVDDDPDVCEALSEVLSDSGYEVETAPDGAIALERLLAAREPPQVVVTDLRMPNLNGVELAAALRGCPRLSSVPVVLCSASPEARALAAGAGLKDVLDKPLDLGRLLALLGELTSGRQTSAGVLATELLRREHAAILRAIAERASEAGTLGEAAAEARAAIARGILGWFQSEVLEHDAWEERFLFPVIDACAPAPRPYTAMLRHQHAVLARWVADLATLAAASPLDPVAFTRRVDRLLGLLTAHLEAEEAVVLGILDDCIADERFQQEVLARARRR